MVIPEGETAPGKLYRFTQVFAEDAELYRRGGYHPVSLQDKVDGGRYTIVSKLGYGNDSTVWMARDEKHELHR